MKNSFIDFGLVLGVFTLFNQIFDVLVFKTGYIEYPSLWAGVTSVLLVGLGIEVYKRVKS